MNNEIKSKIDLALFNFYLEADRETINVILKEDMQNLDDYTKKKRQIIFLSKAIINKKHNEYLLELASKFQDAILQNIEKPVAILRQLIQSNAAFALYSNLDKLSREDILEIIKDKNLVDLLEELDKNENQQ
ncbi:MAG: hypothetical protein ABR974_08320 [Bacteroidales bacterium]|jgi:Mg/Co/Ni transporter MgtE